MLKVKKIKVLLEPTNLPFEAKAVLNPATFRDGKYVHLFYRAIDNNNCSSIGYALLKGPTKIIKRWRRPIIHRKFPYESKGVEDPRIVKIDNLFYLFYTAHDGKNALAAYATSKNLKKFEKKGLITPLITYDEAEDVFRESRLKDRYFFFESYYKDVAGKDVLLWEKDAFLFPKKFNGQFALIHRILPDIQVIYFDKFSQLKNNNFWRSYLKDLGKYVILENKFGYESRNIGGGAPPIETKKGWLLIYHAVEDSNKGRIYHAGAALLSKNNPTKVIGHLPEPLFSPERSWEKQGEVSNVVFPTGTAIFGGNLYIYYGAADKRIAVARVNLNELLRELTKKRKKPGR
ncbi:MAG: pesticidal protein Cry7Aa [bacterium]